PFFAFFAFFAFAAGSALRAFFAFAARFQEDRHHFGPDAQCDFARRESRPFAAEPSGEFVARSRRLGERDAAGFEFGRFREAADGAVDPGRARDDGALSVFDDPERNRRRLPEFGAHGDRVTRHGEFAFGCGAAGALFTGPF